MDLSPAALLLEFCTCCRAFFFLISVVISLPHGLFGSVVKFPNVGCVFFRFLKLISGFNSIVVSIYFDSFPFRFTELCFMLQYGGGFTCP